ncbi:MAG: aspartate--tRNA ligase [Gemmatales bacterium]|nr:aspartate--tRNA ligase [Gemmatales bacterium]MDW8388417.1 aspartate--tRNA ligase [Gemmatales bacterium]
MQKLRRTHTCGELRQSDVGKEVVLCGWVHTYRDHGGLVFVDLRDRYGMTQIVFDPECGKEVHEIGRSLRSEYVVAVQGEVVARPADKRNPKIATGDIEVRALRAEILNTADPLPFDLTSSDLAGEEIRLQYRYLDLRRPAMQQILILRHRLNHLIRNYFDQHHFIEVETPMLGRSTPEGARDYLVPSRIHIGSWYALPQSPQLYKQILMVAGFDRYYQIARCLRDEDLRANRQPEFTQLDMEMSFVEREDIFEIIEGMTALVFKELIQVEIPLPLPRIKYADAMLRYGNDKPDLRFGLEIQEVSDLAGETEFRVFRSVLESGGKVRGLCVPGGADKFSRKGLDELEEIAKRFGAKGLAWIKVEAERFNSPIEKFLPGPIQARLRERFGAKPGDLLLFVADKEETVCAALSAVRNHLGEVLNLCKPGDYKLAWIIDFPLLQWDTEENRWVANHHPFTSPMDEDMDRLESDPGSVRAKAYDLVINGDECGGGSIRIHRPDVQQRVFNLLGIGPEQARKRFGFLLDALRFGAPPHGGIALGLDRWVMMLAGLNNIRDCIAFPKTQRATDLMTGAPAPVDPKQLKELGLK